MESSGRTLVCSVLFLDIVEYSKKPVSDQLTLKQEFNRLLSKAREQVPQRDRIILDTGDGAAVTFMGDPEDALFASMAVRDTAGAVAVRLGVNLGPVRLVKDLNGQMNIIGDGINVAQRVMSFAQPGQLLVSRSFYEVVSCLSRDYANLFHHEGARAERKAAEKPLAGGGRVELAVAPWGEVLVDGKSRGVSPPLRVVDVSAGAHTIEIRNSTFPAHVEQVQVKAGEAVKIRHRFR